MTQSCACASQTDDYREKVTICSPSKDRPIIDGGCLTKGSLMKIVEVWNHTNPTNTIKFQGLSANDLYRLVQKTMKDEFGCKDETCWVANVVPEDSPYQGTRQSLLSLYRPVYPDRFKEKPNSWWSTSLINSVIEPYQWALPMYWCGVVPLDFKEQRAVNICLSREACSVDVEDLIDKGCCSICAVFNLDYSWERGSHWVAGIVDLRRGDVCFFDSFGYEPLTLIQEWLENCRSSLNSLVMKKKWMNTSDRIIQLKKEDLKWMNATTMEIQAVIPHTHKIQDGCWMESLVSKRMIQIKERIQRKQFIVSNVPTKSEREGGWKVMGARTHFLSKRVQTTTTECGTYCIHVILSMIHGKSWRDTIQTLPKDKEIKELRKKLFRQK